MAATICVYKVEKENKSSHPADVKRIGHLLILMPCVKTIRNTFVVGLNCGNI